MTSVVAACPSGGAGGDVLASWAVDLSGRAAKRGRGVLRFAFYGRVSTEDWQDPESSRARQLQQAVMLTAGRGVIAAEFFDTGETRVLPWARRPQAAALVAQLADPDRGWDAIVVGEYERAFYGSQYALMAPLFEHYGVSLWMPEVGGRVDWHAEDHEETMLALGLSSKREIARTRVRVRTAMAAQTLEQGRYLGGRPPYGYRLADAGPHPNKAHAAWGRRAHRLEPDPETAPVVTWMFAQRLAGHSAARITRALNDAGVPCPSAADPGRNPHRAGRGVDAADGGGDPGQPAVHGAAGVEPAAVRGGPGRPGQHRARPQAGAAVEPARGLGHLQASRARGAGQRGRLHRRPGHGRAAGPGRAGGTPVPAGRAPRVRAVRAPAGISLVPRQARLPVPPRLHQRRRPRSRPAEDHLPPRGRDPAAPGRPRHPPRRQAGSPDRAAPGELTAPAHGSPDRPAARRRRRPDLRPARPDPARRRSRHAVRHHRHGPLTAGPGKEAA